MLLIMKLNKCEMIQRKINEYVIWLKEIYYNYYYCDKCGKKK